MDAHHHVGVYGFAGVGAGAFVLDFFAVEGTIPGAPGLPVRLAIPYPDLLVDNVIVSRRSGNAFGGDGLGEVVFADLEFLFVHAEEEEPVRGNGSLDDLAEADGLQIGDPFSDLGHGFSAIGDDLRKLLQLHAADGGFQLGHPVVEAEEEVGGLLGAEGFASIRKAFGIPVKFLVVGEDDPALSACGGVFAAHQAEGRDVPDGADLSALVFGVVGLAGILDHDEVVGLGEFHNGVHVAWLSGDVPDDDGFRSVADPLLYGFRIHIEGFGIRVREDGDAVHHQNGRHGSGIGDGRGDDFASDVRAERG